MNGKILGSIFSITVALALVTGSAYAVFTSAASNNDNTFAAGSMTLLVNTQGPTSTPVFTVTGFAPNDSQTQVLTLKNNGSVPAASTKLVNISHSSTSTPDLGDKLMLELYDDVNNDGVIDGGDLLKGSAAITSLAWSNIDLGFGLAAGAEHKVLAKITFDGTADGTYQSTNSKFDLNFQISQ